MLQRQSQVRALAALFSGIKLPMHPNQPLEVLPGPVRLTGYLVLYVLYKSFYIYTWPNLICTKSSDP